MPLDEKGRDEAKRIGKIFADAGGVDYLISSDMLRARQTAAFIKNANPDADGPLWAPKLQPWHLGEYEGQETSKVIGKINALMLTPDTKAPGKSPKSTAPGETFNQFASRVLTLLRSLWEFSEEWREDRIVAVTHLRIIKLAEACINYGGLKDLHIHMETMQQDGEGPGSIFRVEKNKLVKVRIPNAMGLYLVRHGTTALNGRAAS